MIRAIIVDDEPLAREGMELNVEGLLHVKDLGNDYYRFDEKSLKFVGKRTKTEFTIGTKLRVKIAKINIGKSQIDFEFIEKL